MKTKSCIELTLINVSFHVFRAILLLFLLFFFFIYLRSTCSVTIVHISLNGGRDCDGEVDTKEINCISIAVPRLL